jgi:hypothetical protein
MSLRLASLLLTGCLGLTTPVFGDPMLTLLPPDLSVPTGTLFGWGYKITNDIGYIEITSAQFCLNPVTFPACTLPTTGTFTDYISGFNDVIVGPGGEFSRAFDPLAHTGIGGIDVTASPGTVDIGQIVLVYNFFPNDPDIDASGGTEGLVFTAAASVTATSGPTVPEPAACLLTGSALLALLMRARRQYSTAPRGRR